MKQIIISLLLIMSIHVSAGEPANYEVVPMPQSIVEQKGAPFILENCSGRLSS